MASHTSDALSIREGLIRIIDVERFQVKPAGDGKTHIVVQEKRGNSWRHYRTLKSPQDTFSVGEQLWGNYRCFVVDLTWRELRIAEELPTRDRVTKVKIAIDVTYRAVDGEKVVLGYEDVLRSLREEMVTVLRREALRSSLEDITEEPLEMRLMARLKQENPRIESQMGITIDPQHTRVRVDWPEEALQRQRQIIEERSKAKAEEERRRRDWQKEDENRRRQKHHELEDIDFLDQMTRRLGLEALPPDVKLHLYALPREEALQQIIKQLTEQRLFVRGAVIERRKEEYALLHKLIDNGVLEEMDLVDFGRDLLHRYQHALAVEDAFGMPASAFLGDVQRPHLGKEGKRQESLPGGAQSDTGAPAGQAPDASED